MPMHESLQNLVDVLDEIEQDFVETNDSETSFNETHGWNWPLVAPSDIIAATRILKTHIIEADIDSINDEYLAIVDSFAERLETFKGNTRQYIFNGNGATAVPIYVDFLTLINSTLAPLLYWQPINDSKLVPAKLARRVRTIDAELKDLTPNKEELEKQIKLINDAVDTAETLPADLQSLRDARNTIDKISTESAELLGKINVHTSNSADQSKALKLKLDEATSIVSQCEEAYRIATSTGLAGAFELRAEKLSSTMVWWVVALIASLSAGAIIGYLRLLSLTTLMEGKDQHWGIILMHTILSILSIGAPLWLAWLSTKQIGQRFRLSEDYAFKASVAKAYEGYRKEAHRIDIDLEKRLFSSALARLEEAPLRLLADDHHGSPWQEAMNSDVVKNLSSIPSQIVKSVKVKPVEEHETND